MTLIDSIIIDRLCAAARTASRQAYAPYSHFHVGAALLLRDGTIVSASNFENASYGMSLCAETVAIAKANSDGQMLSIIAIAVVGGPPDADGGATLTAEAVTPCGRCRQIIKEVADLTDNPDLPIYCVRADGHDIHPISQLLPHGFGPANLR